MKETEPFTPPEETGSSPEKVKRTVRLIFGAMGLVFLVAGLVLWMVWPETPEELPEIVTAKERVAEDRVLEKLIAFGKPLEGAFDDHEACHDFTSLDVYSLECRALVERHQALLDGLDAWEATAPKFGLGPSPTRTSRFPPFGFTDEVPNIMGLITLGRLHRLAALHAFQAGDAQRGRALLNRSFALGAFCLDGSSNLIAAMVGLSVLTSTAETAAYQLDGAELAALVPHTKTLQETAVRGLVSAMGGEWAAFRDLYRQGIQDMGAPFDSTGGDGPDISWETAQATGLYIPEHTIYLATLPKYEEQQHALGTRLGSAFGPEPHPEWDEMGLIKYIHNPIGRILVSIATPGSFVPRAGEAHDRLAALQVLAAARTFQEAEGRWPASREELVPAYLPSWPTSRLDGQPLPWEPTTQRIRFLEEDGVTLNKEDEDSYPFSPLDVPPPLSEAAPLK